jgi:hypothetical protein
MEHFRVGEIEIKQVFNNLCAGGCTDAAALSKDMSWSAWDILSNAGYSFSKDATYFFETT